MIVRITPPAFVAQPALQAVLEALPRARLVGGCVRDTIAGMPVADVDLATPDVPEAVLGALRAAGLEGVPTGIAHGTITAISGGTGFEVTTLRRDIATDGRHAEIAWTRLWEEDAARRDFTFNALSMTPLGEVHDLFDGIADLHAGRVRFVGDAATRLAEDRLRALRYFRFFARYAALPPDRPTAAALKAVAPELRHLSAERVWAELKRILAAPDPRGSLRLMQQLGVLSAVLPQAGDPGQLDRLIADDAPADPLLRLAALIGPDAPSPAVGLRFSLAEAGRLAALRTPPVPRRDDDDRKLRKLLADTSAELLIARAWLHGSGASVRARLATLPAPRFPLRGRDALALGATPGPAVGIALHAVGAWWRDGGCVADRTTCLARLASVLLGSDGAG